VNDNVDYRAPAELFPAAARRGRVAYHRFDTLSDALRFAVEELTPALLGGAVIESEEVRYGAAEIRGLYEAAGYPLARRR
jgi:hypothetical protein